MTEAAARDFCLLADLVTERGILIAGLPGVFAGGLLLTHCLRQISCFLEFLPLPSPPLVFPRHFLPDHDFDTVMISQSAVGQTEHPPPKAGKKALLAVSQGSWPYLGLDTR